MWQYSNGVFEFQFKTYLITMACVKLWGFENLDGKILWSQLEVKCLLFIYSIYYKYR